MRSEVVGKKHDSTAEKDFKELENHTKKQMSGCGGGLSSMLRSPVGWVIRGMQGGGSGGRIKAV